MSGAIIIPDVLYGRWVSYKRWDSLFNMVCKYFGWEKVVTDDFSVNNCKYDIVMSFKAPMRSDLGVQKELYKLDKPIKYICYVTDIHNHYDIGLTEYKVEDTIYNESVKRLFDRADLILCLYETTFMSKWGEFADKLVVFPQFVDGTVIEGLEFNNNPATKCLLTGFIGDYYPLRKHIFLRGHIEYLHHPGYGNDSTISKSRYKIGADYYKELNKYFCSVATSSIVNYVVAKYFEIPAVGTLLLGQYTPDLEALGFVDGNNYVKLTKDNACSKIWEVLQKPEEHETIRRNGMQFVLDNHTHLQRFEYLKNFIEGLQYGSYKL
jgi:hypothetical protein